MRDFYRWKKYDRAMNNWNRAKHLVWQNMHPDDDNAAAIALANIGRNGYRATKGIELLDSLIGTTSTEFVVKTAAAKIKIAKELGVKDKETKQDYH